MNRRYRRLFITPLYNSYSLASTTAEKISCSIKLILFISLLMLSSLLQAAQLSEGKRYEVCQEILRKINNTPDFFNQVKKNGYRYILYESPFKKTPIERIPKFFIYPIGLQAASLSKQRAVYSIIKYNGCSEHANKIEECDKQIKDEIYPFKNKDHTAVKSNSSMNIEFFDNDTAQAYKTTSNIFSNSTYNETIVGLISTNQYKHPSEINDEPFHAVFYIVDEYMRLNYNIYYQKTLYEQVYLFDKGTGYSPGFSGVPIDVAHRTYVLSILIKKNKSSIYIDEYSNVDRPGPSHNTICVIKQ